MASGGKKNKEKEMKRKEKKRKKLSMLCQVGRLMLIDCHVNNFQLKLAKKTKLTNH